MAKEVAQDRPLSHEEVGVIGSLDNSVANPDAGKFAVAPTEVQLRPADADNVFTETPSGFAKVTPPEEVAPGTLPEGFEDWEAYKRANASAREAFSQTVFFPGAVFRAGGHYHNAQKLDETYDVTEGEIVPEGLYLFPTNYLVTTEARTTNGRAPVQPNPLRSNKRS